MADVASREVIFNGPSFSWHTFTFLAFFSSTPEKNHKDGEKPHTQATTARRTAHAHIAALRSKAGGVV
jgi:hypothetical protein